MARVARGRLAGSMPTPLARLRLAVARLLCRGRGAGAGADGSSTVPVTVRARTADRADMRLLLEVRVEAGSLQAGDLDRFVHQWTVPATRAWVAQHDLAGLQADLAPELDEVAATVRDGLATVGATLLGVELVAAEHLLASPSADPADGPG